MKSDEKPLSYMKAWTINLRAWKIWWKFRPSIFVSCVVCAVCKSAAPYIAAYLSAHLLNELFGEQRSDVLIRWIVLLLALEALLAFMGGLAQRWNVYEKSVVRHLNNKIYIEKMISLDYGDIERQYVFDLYSLVMQNENWSGWGIHKTLHYFEKIVQSGTDIFGGILLSFSLFTAQIPGDSALAWLNHPVWTVLVLGMIAGTAVFFLVCSNQQSSYWSNYAQQVRLGNRFFEFFGMMSRDRYRALDLRMYGQQENVCKVYMKRENIFGPGSAIARDARGLMGVWGFLGGSVSAVLTGIIYVFVCIKIMTKACPVGSMIQYISAVTRLFAGLSNFLSTIGMIRDNGYFIQSCFEFLDIPNKMYKGSLTTEKRSDRQYMIEFQDVSFKYPDSDQWVLRHINFKFKVGSRLAVVGVNGSGKTTFIKLLCRLYDPDEGKILLNGIDIRKYNYNDYIQLFSVVFQDFKLLACPMGDNVACSSYKDEKKVNRCLAYAGLTLSKQHMPKGIDTPLYKDLESDGVEVSGGEAQKIAIARALYKNAPFMILDEPTAALDPLAEAEIYSKFDAIASDKTTVYISHRLSSCKFCDEIIVFDEGRIVEQGTHEKLLADKKGKYTSLWNAQAGYYTKV